MKALRDILVELQKNLKENEVAQSTEVTIEFWTADGSTLSHGEGVKVSFALTPGDTKPAAKSTPQKQTPVGALANRAKWAAFQQD